MRIDPRISIFILLSFFLVILATYNLFFLLGIICLFIVWYLTLTSFRYTFKILLFLIFPTIIIIILNWIFVSSQLQHILTMVLRFWSLSWLFNWFLKEVDPEDLAKALWAIYVPYRVAWQISLAYRYLPLFQEESQRIYQSQISRGIPLDGGFVQKLRNLQSLSVPLLVMTQEKAYLLSEALFARNWNIQTPKTVLNPLKMTGRDWVVFFAVVSIGIIVLLI